MNSRAKASIRYSISVLLMLVFLYFTFRKSDWARMYASMKEADYWWILLMFACLVVSHIVRAWRGRYLLEPIKRDIGMRNLVSSVMVGYMVNNVLPRAGELVRPYALGKLENIPKSAVFGTIVVERIIDTFAFLVLVAMMPLLYNGPLREAFPWLDNARFVISVVTIGFVLVIIVFVIRRDWTDAMIRLAARVLPRRAAGLVEKLAHSFLDGFLFFKHPRNLALILAQSVVIWLLYIGMVYTAFFAFGLNLDFNAAIIIQAISSIGVAMPTPGGTGSYHMFTSQALSKLFGVSNDVALSYATVTHAVGFIGIMIIGLYYFFKDHIKVSEAVTKGVEEQ